MCRDSRASDEEPDHRCIADRDDLDYQLFGTFSRCKDLLRQPPVQATSHAHLRELLSVTSGGVVKVIMTGSASDLFEIFFDDCAKVSRRSHMLCARETIV